MQVFFLSNKIKVGMSKLLTATRGLCLSVLMLLIFCSFQICYGGYLDDLLAEYAAASDKPFFVNGKKLTTEECERLLRMLEEGQLLPTRLRFYDLNHHPTINVVQRIARILPTNNSSLTELNLSHSELKPEEIEALAKALKENQSLTYLDLSHNQIGAEGARALAEVLKVNRNLTHLDIGFNQIGVEGASTLVKALEYNQGLTELILRNRSIPNNHLDNVMHPLGVALRKNSTLMVLNLNGNIVTTAGIRRLVEALGERGNRTLKELNLSDDDLDNDGRFTLLKLRTYNPELYIDCLDWRGVSEVVTEKLSSNDTSLIALNLSNLRIRDIEQLSIALASNKILQELALNGLEVLTTEAGVRELLRGLTNNRSLKVLKVDTEVVNLMRDLLWSDSAYLKASETRLLTVVSPDGEEHKFVLPVAVRRSFFSQALAPLVINTCTPVKAYDQFYWETTGEKIARGLATLLTTLSLGYISLNIDNQSIGPSNLADYKLRPNSGGGNCFFYAVAQGLMPDMELYQAADLLRHRVQGRSYRNGSWVGYEAIVALLEQRHDIALAILDTRHPELGFVYHYYNANLNTVDFTRNVDIVVNRTIIKVAYTGNHYLAVEN